MVINFINVCIQYLIEYPEDVIIYFFYDFEGGYDVIMTRFNSPDLYDYLEK